MSFTESNLLDGERVIYRAKLHWSVFFRPALFLVFVVLCDLFIWRMFRGMSFGYMMRDYQKLINSARLILWAAMLIYLAFVIFDFITTEIFVTTKRITRKKGIISIQTLDIKLNMVEAVLLNQGIIGRLFNYGHVSFTGVGAMLSKFRGIYNPLKLRNVIIRQIIPGASAPPTARRPG